jgi:hypothetical protein
VKPEKKYGVDFNMERKRIGVATLPDTWITNDRVGKTRMWYPRNRIDSGSFRSSKIIVEKSGDIMSEQDVYLRIGRNKYEKLTIGYNYKNHNSWECKYYNPATAVNESIIEKRNADSILNSWGLQYK